MTRPASKTPWQRLKLRFIDLQLALTLNGWQVELSLTSFVWCGWFYHRTTERKGLHGPGMHLYIGPLHVWTMQELSSLFELNFKVGQDPYRAHPKSVAHLQ